MDELVHDQAIYGTHGRRSFAYRADIDGLRAVAVVSVFLFHLGIAAFPGGFVGVDVFFVISGYLITWTILADRARGRFSLGRFYDRRIRRIFPALFVMSFACFLVAASLSTPQDMERFGKSLVAMALFVSNIFERYTGTPAGYFGDNPHPDLLLHTWSLSVEEQFYILLPVSLVWLLRRKANALGWMAGAGLVSFALCVVWTRLNQKEAFYFVFTRAWELLLGTVLTLAPWRPKMSRPAREAVAAIGLAMIATAVLFLSNATAFPGAAALLPCAGTFLVILAGEQGSSLVGRVLASRPFVFVGALSYSLYLWHWPTIVFVKQLTIGEMPPTAMALVVVIASLAAYLSYRFIETPFRRRGALFSERGVLAAGVGASLVTVAVGVGLAASDGLAARFSPTTQAVIAGNYASESDHFDNACSNWKRDVRSVTDIDSCPLGAGKAKNILFIGDSHVRMLRPLIETLSKQNALAGRGAIFAVSAGCPLVEGLAQAKPGYHCNAFAHLAMKRAGADDIDTVFIGFSAWWDSDDFELCRSHTEHCDRLLTEAEAAPLFVDGLRAHIRALRQRGKQVILMLPSPIYELGIPQYEIHEAMPQPLAADLSALGLKPSLHRLDFLPLRKALAALAAETDAIVFDPRKSVCKNDDCIYARDGVSIYSDSNHVATHALPIYENELQAALRQLPTVRSGVPLRETRRTDAEDPSPHGN